MDHFPRDVTHMRKFGYYSVDPAWRGNYVNLMYGVLWEKSNSLMHFRV